MRSLKDLLFKTFCSDKNKLKIEKLGFKMCFGFLKSGVKSTFKTGKNKFFTSQNVSWYVQTSTQRTLGCSTRNL